MNEKKQYNNNYKKDYKKSENGYKKPFKKTDYKQLKNKPKIEEKFDVEKWLKQHQNIEYPKRSKRNTIEDGRRR